MQLQTFLCHVWIPLFLIISNSVVESVTIVESRYLISLTLSCSLLPLRCVYMVKFFIQILFKLDLSNCFKHKFDSLKTSSSMLESIWIGVCTVKFMYETGA